MASSPKVTPQKDNVPEKGGSETPPDSPLLDLSDAAVKKLIRSAKKRGYLTHDQINAVLHSEEVNSEQIEDVLAMFRAEDIGDLLWPIATKEPFLLSADTIKDAIDFVAARYALEPPASRTA